jgi:hypothetical protein
MEKGAIKVVRKQIRIFSVVCLLVTGCAITSPNVTYYTLQSTAKLEHAATPSTLSIAIGPADFPNYLQRNQIVTRSNNRIDVNEYHRWGASFESTVLNTLGEYTRLLLNTSHIVVYPSVPRFDIDYRVVMDVVQFEGARGGEVVLNVRWMVLDGTGQQALAVEHTKLSQNTPNSSYDALVDVYSSLLAQLSKEIVDTIHLIEKGK